MGSGIDLESLPLLARGGQADIYGYESGKVLRVPRRVQDHDRIRYEREVYSFLADCGIAAPKVYGIIDVGGAPAIVMERLHGASMMERIGKRPFSIWKVPKELAGMHLDLLRHGAGPSFMDAKEKARHCILQSGRIDAALKERLLEVLQRLPEGDRLCHGDFHPGNIICQDGRNRIIDWSSASRGDPASDVAHTFLLMRVVPRVPSMGPLMHRIQKRLARSMAEAYRRTMFEALRIPACLFSRWVLIAAAERTFYGLPSEQGPLRSFIGKYMGALDRGGSEDDLHRLI